ncbi:uncharacterized protein LACBIDRAFT_327533 [Laccaria bicolor S238N-H82]|uniref:Predicted protein n=1 Tax=Laccaria bicolor (strain S238N-H82 / ATCC MYA-4686) TaxID=486041 RepID=B0DC14_LACBS|nr:uncharacterized protein LACBIDRAFT_327533 [Laccaria bicolor S238N-H82]EDR07653.1 predicted protein [Laccaria bicolor S238N-H82]|eukprot:XP_001881442.1 predicted protein [Laccaria bicolor S238N-H82]
MALSSSRLSVHDVFSSPFCSLLASVLPFVILATRTNPMLRHLLKTRTTTLRMLGVDEDHADRAFAFTHNQIAQAIACVQSRPLNTPSCDDNPYKSLETSWPRLRCSLALHWRSCRSLPGPSRLVEPIIEGMQGGDQVGRGSNLSKQDVRHSRPHSPYNTTTFAVFYSLAGTKHIHSVAQPRFRKGEDNPHRPSCKPWTDKLMRMYFCESFVGLGHERACTLGRQCLPARNVAIAGGPFFVRRRHWDSEVGVLSIPVPRLALTVLQDPTPLVNASIEGNSMGNTLPPPVD